MSNIDNDVNVESSTTGHETASTSSNGSLAGRTIGQAFKDYDAKLRGKPEASNRQREADDQDSQSPESSDTRRQRRGDVSDEVPASSDSEARVSPTDSQSVKNQESLSPGVKKRLDGLVTKHKKEQDAHKQTLRELETKSKAIELLKQEVDAYKSALSKGKADPRELELLEMKQMHEVELFKRDLESNVDKRYNNWENTSTQSDRAAVIKEQLESVIGEYVGIIQPQEVANYLRQQRITDPTEAVEALRDLGNSRIDAARARSKASKPTAPRTSGVSGNGAIDPPVPFRYQGYRTIKDYIDKDMKAKQGK